MNKKTYHQPVTSVVVIAAATIMAGSLGSSDTPSVNFNNAENGSGMDADSRRSSFWGDADE